MTSLLSQFDITEDRVRRIVSDTIEGSDDGELFLEYREGESLMFDNGRLKTANFNTDQGFGLRAVAGEATGYAHSSELSEAALLRASDAVSAVKGGYTVVAMGEKVGAALSAAGVRHVRIPHPAARGAVRKKAVYALVVKYVLANVETLR